MRRNVVNVMMGFFVSVVFGMVGCGGGSNNDSTSTAGKTDSVTITAGSAGAIAKTPSGNASIEIPAGALTSNVNTSIAASDGGDLPGAIGVSYEFGPSGTTFNIPVTISLKYDISLIPEGSSEQDLVIAYEANGGWVELSNPEIDTVNKVIKAKTSHFSKYAVTQKKYPGGYGGLLGSFNNVNVYSNGDSGFRSDDYNNYNGTSTGMKWQCVEFVNRYYLQVYNMNIRIAGENAKDYYRKASDRGLVAYSNGIVGTVEPQVGDIIVSEGTSRNDGHVAIVRKVTSDKIYLVQQNYLNTQSDADGSFLRRHGNALEGFGGNDTSYPIRGWLRKPGNTSGDSISIISISPTSAVANHVTSFAVKVSYSLTSKNSGLLMVGFNTNQVDLFRTISSQEYTVTKGSGTHTFNVTTTPVNWGSTGSFMSYVNLSENPHPLPWTPLASDAITISTFQSVAKSLVSTDSPSQCENDACF